MRVHRESIFQKHGLDYNKCLYLDYFRLIWVGTAVEYLRDSS